MAYNLVCDCTRQVQEQLLEQAVKSLQAALEVFTQEFAPYDWAEVHGELGRTRREQAKIEEGRAQARHLEQAVKSLQAAMKIFTPESAPDQWARVQTELGLVIWEQAEIAGNADKRGESLALMMEAAAAFRAALQVTTREYWPYNWAVGHTNLGNVLGDTGVLMEGSLKIELFRDATKAFQAALEVFTRKYTPHEWATNNVNLGITLSHMAESTEGEEQVNYWGQAIAAYQSALDVYTKKYSPGDWATVQFQLAKAYVALAAIFLKEDRLKSCDVLMEAHQYAKHALSVFTEQMYPSEYYQATMILNTAEDAIESFGCKNEDNIASRALDGAPKPGQKRDKKYRNCPGGVE